MTAARKVATYEDLLALPDRVTGQLVFGVLHAHPRPALPHANAATVLGEELGPPFRRGRGGPGGWLILDEPELHLGDDVLRCAESSPRQGLPELRDGPLFTQHGERRAHLHR